MNDRNRHPSVRTDAQRRRLADQIANRLHTAAMYGHRARFDAVSEAEHADLSTATQLRHLLHQAPQAAATADAATLRTARSGRGALLVLRIHGPDWSLVMTGGRPLPAYLIAIHDTYRPGTVWSLRDPHWVSELQSMCRRIDEALNRRQ